MWPRGFVYKETLCKMSVEKMFVFVYYVEMMTVVETGGGRHPDVMTEEVLIGMTDGGPEVSVCVLCRDDDRGGDRWRPSPRRDDRGGPDRDDRWGPRGECLCVM